MSDVIESNGAPESNVPSVAEGSAPDTGVNWGDLDVEVDGGAYVEEPIAPVAEPTPAQPVQQAPAQTPSAPQQQPQVQGQQPAQAPQTPAASPEVQTPEGQQQVQQPPVNAAELQRQFREQLEAEFAISQDDALALSTAPETVMPKLAANMYQRIMQDVMQQFQQFGAGIPAMMQQYVERSRADAEAKQEFYGEWPGLSQHHDRVMANAILVRQANPNATRQQMIEMAGVMTAMALGVDPMSVRKQAGQATAQPQRQFQPVQAQIPPRPAGLAPAQNLSVGESNIFGEFANEDMNWLKG